MARAAWPTPDRMHWIEPWCLARCATVPLIVAALLLAALPAHAAAPAGKVTFVRGIASVQGSDGSARLIARNAPIYEGDVVRTAERSYAVLQLDDESNLTLRPNSVFQVEEYKEQGQAGGSVLLSLFKGGLRAVTGLIGKRNPRGYRLRSPTATIGIRGTDFEARLCEEDCAREVRGARRTPARAPRVIGRVAFLSGQASAAGIDGKTRALSLGGSLFEGDMLKTQRRSVAVLVFRDESRVTMRAGSTLRVDEYRYDRKDPDKSSFGLNFLRGGIRMVSGLIAKLRPRRVRLKTPVATIAVRGTGFELKCEDPCSAKDQAATVPSLLDFLVPPARAQGPVAGMSAFVFDGVIEFILPGGTLTLNQGNAVFFDGINPPVTLPNIPVYFQQVSAAQQQLDANTDQGVVDSATTPPTQQDTAGPGLYVRVIEGDVAVTGNDGDTTLAGAGQIVVANPQTGDVYEITIAPGTLPPLTPSGLSLTGPAAAPGEALDEEPQSEFQCVVQ